MKKTRIILLTALLFILPATGCSKTSAAASGQVLASSEEAVVYADDYKYFYNMNLNFISQLYGSMGYDVAEMLDEDMDGQTMGEMLQEEALFYAQNFALYVALAEKDGITLDNLDYTSIDEDIESIKEAYPNKKDFDALYGLNEEELRAFLERMAKAEKFIEKVESGITVSEEEARAEFDRTKSEYNDQVTVKHILISCDDEMSEEEQKAAEELAQELLERIQNGEAIGSLVAEYTDDGGSAATEGEYTFGKGEMVPEFEEWAFAATKGDQGVVKSDFGYHIMESIRGQGEISFDDVKDTIEENLRGNKIEDTMAELLREDEVEWTVDDKVLKQAV